MKKEKKSSRGPIIDSFYLLLPITKYGLSLFGHVFLPVNWTGRLMNRVCPLGTSISSWVHRKCWINNLHTRKTNDMTLRILRKLYHLIMLFSNLLLIPQFLK